MGLKKKSKSAGARASGSKSAGSKSSRASSKSGKKKAGKKSGKKRSKSAPSLKTAKPQVDIMSTAAMENLYFIAHGPVQALEMRGFAWPEKSAKKGGRKGKRKGKAKKKKK